MRAAAEDAGRARRAALERRHTEFWSDAFEQLVHAGHRHADILNYTMAQFEGYLRRALRREREERRMQVLIAASAFDDELRRSLLQTLSTSD